MASAILVRKISIKLRITTSNVSHSGLLKNTLTSQMINSCDGKILQQGDHYHANRDRFTFEKGMFSCAQPSRSRLLKMKGSKKLRNKYNVQLGLQRLQLFIKIEIFILKCSCK